MTFEGRNTTRIRSQLIKDGNIRSRSHHRHIDAPPRLVKTHSGSSSNASPITMSSLDFHRRPIRRAAGPSSTVTPPSPGRDSYSQLSSSHSNTDDTSILRGAEILRHQLVHSISGREDPPEVHHHTTIITPERQQPEPPSPRSSSSSRMRPPVSRSSKGGPRRDPYANIVYDIDPHLDDSEELFMDASYDMMDAPEKPWHRGRNAASPIAKNDEPHRASSPIVFRQPEDPSLWANLSFDNTAEDTTQHTDEDTIDMLHRSSQMRTTQNIAAAAATTASSIPAWRFAGGMPDRSLSLSNTTERAPPLVQRVDEMDNSTFASSYLEGADRYLPQELLTPPPPPPLDELDNEDELLSVFQLRHVEQSFESTISGRPSAPTHCNPLDVLQDLQAEEDHLMLLHSTADRQQQQQQHHLVLTDDDDEDGNAYFQDAEDDDDDGDDIVNMIENNPREVSQDEIMSIPEGPCPGDCVVNPLSKQYAKLHRDTGYLHAKSAGVLWQSLVSQHVRFPSTWWKGSRSPPMGLCTPNDKKWSYYGRSRVRGDEYLQSVIHHRGSNGRLLLHIVVQDIITRSPVQDICVGAFHPNARGVRSTAAFDPSLEDCRDIWLASRSRVNDDLLLESLMGHGRQQPNASPLGVKHAVTNNNMRAVFGETPPVLTVFIAENEIYEMFAGRLDGTVPPAAVLLEEYMRDW